MFDRHKSGEKVILVHVNFVDDAFDAKDDLAEFNELATSAGAEIAEVVTLSKRVPDPKYFIGTGKVDEISELVAMHKVDVVLFNHQLTPSQERNLERRFECRVIDRTGLILDIFAQRARTFEGKLQVEFAQLQYISTRLVRGWTHLERQKGGIGLRGPGETQLETDRRLLRDRIKFINKRLSKVRQQREQGRHARQRAAMPTVSLVGYTNAGKSTLFNTLTGDDTFVADKLFATLDPTLRKVGLPGTKHAVLADTVGFIRHLPHDLVESFRATLEETRDASLLLHVIDLSDKDWRDNTHQVENVLNDIGAGQIPVLQVFNKIDALEDCVPHTELGTDGKPTRVWVSAKLNQGMDLLREAIVAHLYGEPHYRTLYLPPQEGALRARLYRLEAVDNERISEDGGWMLHVRLTQDSYLQIPELLLFEESVE